MFENFHLKDLMLLECYLLRKLFVEKFILLEDFGLMTFRYSLEGFTSMEDFEISLIFL